MLAILGEYIVMGLLILAGLAWGQGLLIENVRILDARGDMGQHTVLIQGQKIVAIDPESAPPEVERLDASGQTMLPGLIDAHVHITMSPGEIYREETPRQRSNRVSHHMRSFLALGVTSLIDPGISTKDVDLVRKLQAEGPSPNVFVVGPLLGPADGYPSRVVKGLPGISTMEEVREQMDAFEAYESYGTKVTFEDGMLMRVMPLFSEELQNGIYQEASERGQNLYIHATDKRGIRRALEMKPHVLVHGPHQFNRKLIRQITESGAYVSSTVDIMGAGLTYFDMDSLNDPLIAMVVPADELATAKDPGIRKEFIEEAWRATAPGWPLWIGRLMYRKSVMRPRVNKVLRGIGKLHESGVDIALASDSSGWPLVPFLFHGISTHLEISFLEEAGLSPLEVIRAATLTPARMLGKEDELGTVEVGKRADLILVTGDPLTDLSTLREPRWVMHDGEIRTPKAWLETVKHTTSLR